MAFAEDLAAFFSTDEFAVSATVGAASVPVIFDKAYIDAMPGYSGGISGSQPRCLMKASDVQAHAVARDTAIVIAGVTYYVQDLQPDGTGLTTLVLSEEAAG
jgi:CTP:molybdopterin cytidylyltransferase MocA